VGARFSAPVQTGPGAHPASCTMGTGSFPEVKGCRGVTLTTHPLLVPWSKKSRAKPLFPPWAVRPVHSLSACIVQLYLYFPYGAYGLYRASVPVQYSYTSTPPIGRTACTEPQFLYSTAIPLLPQCLYSTAIPLLPQCLYSTAISLLPQYLYNGALYSKSSYKIDIYYYSASLQNPAKPSESP